VVEKALVAEKAPVLTPKKKPTLVGHFAQGVLNAINSDGSVSITHQPIQSLGWPGMTMDFALANAALVSKIPVGSAIDFEIVERKADDWVITKISLAHGAH
jgi:Cu(I)/Ag(I) efflux system membrane fusion protein